MQCEHPDAKGTIEKYIKIHKINIEILANLYYINKRCC